MKFQPEGAGRNNRFTARKTTEFKVAACTYDGSCFLPSPEGRVFPCEYMVSLKFCYHSTSLSLYAE